MKRYAIIGFGCAGYSAAKAIRTREKEGEIHVFEATREAPANPIDVYKRQQYSHGPQKNILHWIWEHSFYAK